ncbi:MAG: hypothetical protein ACOC54_03435, partial [Candidatus Sumerlaeota bacterium]
MRTFFSRIFLLPVCALLLTLLNVSAFSAEDPDYLRYMLKAHGIPTEPVGLTRFLEQGWQAARPPKPLPQDPPNKSALLLQAWDLAGRQYEEIYRNPGLVKSLGSLARKYARKEIPEGARRILEADLAELAAANEAAMRATMLDFFQYNGVMAMGVFAERSEANRATVSRVLQGESRTILRIAYMQVLALLGDGWVIDKLVAEVGKANRTSSVAAVNVLENLTGRLFRYDKNMARGPRVQAAEEIMDWWEVHYAGYIGQPIGRMEILERMYYEEPERKPRLDNLPDLLRAAADKGPGASESSRMAWQILERSGASLA